VSQTRLPKQNSLSEAVGYGAIWVTGIGVTYEISETTGRIVRTISTPGTFPDGCRPGIATGAGAVWVTHSCHGIYRIDPHSGRVTASIRVPEVGDVVAVADGLVWVTNYNGWLLRIQPRTDRIVGKWIPIGFGDWGITRTAGVLWVTSYFGSPTVSRIDLTTGAAKVLPNLTDIVASGAGSLWTSAGQRVDPATAKVIASPVIPGSATLVTFWKGSAWALIEQRSLELLRISPATNEVSGEPVQVGKPLPAGYRGSDPVSVAAGPTGLWVLDYGRDLLFHLAMKPAAAAVPSQRR
jgi:streptogramin lyase